MEPFSRLDVDETANDDENSGHGLVGFTRFHVPRHHVNQDTVHFNLCLRTERLPSSFKKGNILVTKVCCTPAENWPLNHSDNSGRSVWSSSWAIGVD